MRKTIKTLLALLLSTTAILAGCDNNNNNANNNNNTQQNDNVAVTGISLSQTSLNLTVGQTIDLVATIAPENASNKGVNWSSSNPGVAMVDSNGKVVAMNDGTAVIIATSAADSSKTAFCTVVVGSTSSLVSVTGVSLNKNQLTLKVGASETLIATVAPANATNKLVSWNSSNTSVATVDSTGKITAIAVGSAKITVTTADGAKTADCMLTVSAADPVGDDDDEEYTIKCNASSGVTATLSKTKAKKGETITLGLAYETGYKFKSISAKNTTLVTVTEGVSYTFEMGTKPVTIDVETTVEGNVVINGEFNAIFAEETPSSGIYVARNVTVPTAKTRYGFSVVVNGTNVKSVKMDEVRCNADLQSGSGGYQFSVAAGCTYDFYYDSTDANYQVYAIRTAVNYLPNNTQTLESLLKGGRMHSQSANHPVGLTSIHYEKKSESQTYDYDYKIFNDNTAFGHTVDKTDPENTKNYYTWKSLDLNAGVYKVINTWAKASGNNESSDDLWAVDPNNNGTTYGKPYAGTFDIVSTNTADADFSKYYMIRERDAVRTLNSAAHYGAELEYEIYESYRGDFTGSAVIGAANAAGSHINITSSSEVGGFKTVVASQLEWNRESDSYEDGAHEAIIYANEMHFRTDGSLLSMDYSETYYSQAKWDFTTHAPAAGVSGVKTTIKVNYGYEAAGAPELGEFNPDNYFISEITNLSLYNEKTGETYDKNVSILNYNDLIELIPYGNGGEKSAIVHDYDFTPSTALDAWQYHVSSVEDSSIVGKNHQNVPIVCGLGQTNVTFSNRTVNGSTHVTKTIAVKGVAKGTVNGFYVDCYKQGYDSYGGDHAQRLYATAGKTMKYYIAASNNTGAPVAYTVWFKTVDQYGDHYSQTSEYCTVIQTGQDLIMNFDTDASNALTSTKTITLRFFSDFYREGFGPTDFTLYIAPNAGSYVGTTWNIARQDNDYAEISFPTMTADKNGYRYGTIKDYFFDGSDLVATDTFSFKYIEDNNNKLTNVYVTDVDIKSNKLYDADEAISTVYSDYDLVFDGLTDTGELKFALSFLSLSYGDDSEISGEYAAIFGTVTYDDENQVEVTGWALATKVVD